MKKFSFLNQFPDAVIVTDKLGDVVFKTMRLNADFRIFPT